MSRELILIPQEKYDMIVKGDVKQIDDDKQMNAKENVKQELLQKKEAISPPKKRKTKQSGRGYVVKRQTNGPPPGFLMRDKKNKDYEEKEIKTSNAMVYTLIIGMYIYKNNNNENVVMNK